MIATTELRKGNLVHDYSTNSPIMFVYQIYTNAVELASDMEGFDDIDCYEEDLVPIPLTDEWLINFDFIKLDVADPFYIHSDFMSIKISLDLKMISFNNLNLHGVKFDFVHQLQNLFFCLTGEELTLKQC